MLTREGPLIYRDVKSRKRGLTRKAAPHLTLKVPRSDSCRNNIEIVFEKGTGFTIPYKHLKYCLSSGDESHLLQTFYCVHDQKKMYGKHSLTVIPSFQQPGRIQYESIFV